MIYSVSKKFCQAQHSSTFFYIFDNFDTFSFLYLNTFDNSLTNVIVNNDLAEKKVDNRVKSLRMTNMLL